jgi:hypothetical protein
VTGAGVGGATGAGVGATMGDGRFWFQLHHQEADVGSISCNKLQAAPMKTIFLILIAVIRRKNLKERIKIKIVLCFDEAAHDGSVMVRSKM